MSVEIERKFKVTGDFRPYVSRSYRICQGYLNSAPERTVRVRIKGDRGYITVKGISSESGTSRYEWEKEIPVGEAADLLRICEQGIIDKTRHIVEVDGPDGKNVFEIDEFHGDNEGLVIAEIELSHEDEDFVRPQWLGEEVTGDKRYYNSYLVSRPYMSW
jgi:adenylate cyclase